MTLTSYLPILPRNLLSNYPEMTLSSSQNPKGSNMMKGNEENWGISPTGKNNTFAEVADTIPDPAQRLDMPPALTGTP